METTNQPRLLRFFCGPATAVRLEFTHAGRVQSAVCDLEPGCGLVWKDGEPTIDRDLADALHDEALECLLGDGPAHVAFGGFERDFNAVRCESCATAVAGAHEISDAGECGRCYAAQMAVAS